MASYLTALQQPVMLLLPHALTTPSPHPLSVPTGCLRRMWHITMGWVGGEGGGGCTCARWWIQECISCSVTGVSNHSVYWTIKTLDPLNILMCCLAVNNHTFVLSYIIRTSAIWKKRLRKSEWFLKFVSYLFKSLSTCFKSRCLFLTLKQHSGISEVLLAFMGRTLLLQLMIPANSICWISRYFL